MRAFAMTGMVTAALMASIISGSLIRATPPSRRMSAGTRSSAMTAHAPASSAILACSAVTTSMMTPPFNISARPRLTGYVPVARGDEELEVIAPAYRRSTYSPRNVCPTDLCPGHQVGRLGAEWRRRVHPGQLDPGATGGQLDRGAVVGRQRVWQQAVGAVPLAVHDLAVAERVHLSGAGRLRLRTVSVDRARLIVDRQHDDVCRIDLAKGGIVVRLATLGAAVRARAGIELPVDRDPVHLQVDAVRRISGGRVTGLAVRELLRWGRRTCGRHREQPAALRIQVVRCGAVMGAVRLAGCPGVGLHIGDDEVGAVDRLRDARISAAPGEDRLVQRPQQLDVLGSAAADGSDWIGFVGLEDCREAGQ